MTTDNLNFNEIGQVIRVNVGKDISSSTPSLFLQPELGLTKEIINGVTIPNVTVETDLQTYNANEYIEYTTIDGDLDYAGKWRKKALVNFSTANIEQTDYVKFRVLP